MINNNLTPVDQLFKCYSCPFSFHKRNDEESTPLGIKETVETMELLKIKVFCRFTLKEVGVLDTCPNSTGQKYLVFEDFDRLLNQYRKLEGKYKQVYADRLKYAQLFIAYEQAYHIYKNRGIIERIKNNKVEVNSYGTSDRQSGTGSTEKH